MDEIKGLVEKLNATHHDFKGMMDRLAAEEAKFGAASAETKAAVDGLAERMASMEAKLNRPGLIAAGGNVDTAAEESKAAWLSFARKGIDGMTPAEVKALSAGTNADGGYTVPQVFANTIVEKIVEYSPIRALANVITISGAGNAITLPAEDGQFSVGWVGETGARGDTTTGTFGQVVINLGQMYAKPKATQDLLDDSAFNVEAFIAKKLGEQFGKAEGAAFISGNGTNKPTGLLDAASGLGGVTAAGVTLAADDLLDLYFDPKSDYAKRGTWCMNRSTLKAIFKLKDLEGRYLWAPGIAGGSPATILDQPYCVCVDMPNVATGAKPVMFGDFKAGYTIVDKAAVAMQRDPFTDRPYVVFYTTRRVGGKVVNAEAISILTMA